MHGKFPGGPVLPEEYFHSLFENFQRARERSANPQDLWFRIGPEDFQFSFADGSLIPLLTPALAHLRISKPASTGAKIFFWDSQHSGVPLFPPPWSAFQGSFLNFHGERHFIQFDLYSRILTAWDFERKLGIFWIQETEDFPFSETGAPLRSILHWWAAASGLQVVHGGAVGDENGAALLAGKGGSGKSSSCAEALRSDLFYLADDSCMVDSGPEPVLYSLYSSLRLNPDMVERFSHLRPSLMGGEKHSEEKPTFLLHPHFSGRLRRSLNLKTVLIPRLTGEARTKIRPTSSMEALRALAPSTIFLSSGMGEKVFQKTAEVVKSLPCFFLELGKDLSQVPAAIQGLLNGFAK